MHEAHNDLIIEMIMLSKYKYWCNKGFFVVVFIIIVMVIVIAMVIVIVIVVMVVSIKDEQGTSVNLVLEG